MLDSSQGNMLVSYYANNNDKNLVRRCSYEIIKEFNEITLI